MTTDNEFNRRRDDRVLETLVRMETTLSAVAVDVRDLKGADKAIDERVRSLEVSRGWMLGAGAGAGGLVGWLAGLFK